MTTDNDTNPYSPIESSAVDGQEGETKQSRTRWVLTGAVWSVFSAFPIAAIIALLFRFPVPLVGYLSGPQAIAPAMMAVLVYGILYGGFILVGFLGAVAGAVIAGSTMVSPEKRGFAVRIASASITTCVLLILAILDKIIGRW